MKVPYGHYIPMKNKGPKYLASGSYSDKLISVWENKDSVVTSYSTKSNVRAITTFVIDEVLFLACAGDVNHDIEVFNTETNEVAYSLSGHTHDIYTLTVYYQDNQCFLVSGGQDKLIKIWDLSTLECKDTLEGHFGVIAHVRSLVVYEINEKLYLASGSNDNTVKIWDLQEKSLITTLEGHTSYVYCIKTFTQGDGMYLVSASNDRSLKVWNLNNYKVEATLSGHETR